MTDKIVALPTAKLLAEPNQILNPLGLLHLERAFAATDRALDDMQVTQMLLERVAEALESGDVARMESVRNTLAARISKRRMDQAGYRASA